MTTRKVVVVPSGDGAAVEFSRGSVRMWCTNTFEVGDEFLCFSHDEWREFLDSVKRGEFDSE